MSGPNSARILENNKRHIPGGVVSVNRATDPPMAFARARGAHMWDADGARYIDYHAAFAAHFLGHNDPDVTRAVHAVLDGEHSLFGAGTTELEGQLAETIRAHVPAIESLQVLNTGSEATYLALRAARAITGRDHVIVMQGGYNGWHNDVACNLMTPLETLGPRVSPGEYAFHAISAGIPEEHRNLVHPVNFNDLDSVAWVCERYPVAAVITEPVLQNIGIVPPASGYLQGLRRLADQHGFLLILDEVKTGFRHAIGGYSAIQNVQPDFAVYGKAVANGYPIAILGGKRRYMDCFVDPDPARRVLLAGTYNAHPVPVAAAIATIAKLAGGEVYRHLEALGARMEAGIRAIASGVTVSRIGSAFCLYFMDHVPADWHDLAAHHDAARDNRFRRKLIDDGVYVFPLAAKQWSISAAHTERDIDVTLEAIGRALT